MNKNDIVNRKHIAMNSIEEAFIKAKKFHVSGDIKKAQELYIKILKTKKNDFLLLSLLGTTFLQLKKYDEAIKNFELSINLNSNYPDNFNNRGIAYAEIKNYQQALIDYDKAISINKNFFSAHLNKSIALNNTKKYNEAILSLQICIKINPQDPRIYNNKGNTLIKLKKYNDALKAYDKAINIQKNFAEAYSNRGDLNQKLQNYDRAIKDYANAVKFNDNLDYVYGKLIHAKMCINQWENINVDLKKIKNGIKEGRKIINPFHLLSLIDDPKLHKQVAIQYSEDKNYNTLKNFAIPKKNKKIKIGYFSADFKNHAVLQLMKDIFKNHDESQFQIYAFNHSTEKDQMTDLISKYFYKFFDCSNLSDKEIADLSIKNNIDIAVNLTGHTIDSRDGIYNYKPAPITVSYLGYPGTMGSKKYNFIIADKITLPKKEIKNYTEKVVYLPECYQPSQAKIDVLDNNITRADNGLPENSFVFSSLNNTYKITPLIFDSWMKILKKTKDSILWLLKSNDSAVENITKEAIKYGVDPKRIIFAKRVLSEEHFQRLKCIDLFLDTFPYNAHTTAKESLRMGVPIITMIGKSFASRVASSILSNIKLEKLITDNLEDYSNLAIRIRKDKKEFQNIKKYLKSSFVVNKLHNYKKFTKDLENIYKKMLEF